MDTYHIDMAPKFRQLLNERTAELRKVLEDEASALASTGTRDVTDFKEEAEDEALAAVNTAQAAQAGQELEEINAALRRLADGSYGVCMDCGSAIDLRRLTALPATAYCTACQAVHEKAAHRH